MSDVIERIDSAIAGLCSCGCGETLTEDSPSAWYASEACYERAHGRAPVEWTDISEWLRVHAPEVELSGWQEAAGRITLVLSAAAETIRTELTPAFRQLAEGFAEVGPHLVIFDELRTAIQASEAWEAREARRNRTPRPSRTTKRSRWRA